MPPRRCLWALALGVVSSLGCGPIEYVSQVTSRAASALSQARREGAEQSAPYEYAKAVEYLEKAREDGGRALYQTAIDWGRRSEDCSRKAVARSRQTGPARDATMARSICGVP